MDNTNLLVLAAALLGATLSVTIMFGSLYRLRRAAKIRVSLLRNVDEWVRIARRHHLHPINERLAKLEQMKVTFDSGVVAAREKLEVAMATEDDELTNELEDELLALEMEQARINRELSEIERLQLQFPRDWAEEVIATAHPELSGEDREYAVNFVANLVRSRAVGDRDSKDDDNAPDIPADQALVRP